MQKGLIFIVAVFFIILFLGGAIALVSAGNGEIRGQVKADLINKYDNKTCDSFQTIEERITCRLVNKKLGNVNVSKASVPESCRNLIGSKKGLCIALYNAVGKCYELKGKDEDKCLKRAVGLRVVANLSMEKNASEMKERAREYASSLLDHVQNKIEKAQENGAISEENATAIIVKLVKIKENILVGKTKAEIKPALVELKAMIKDAINRGEIEEKDE
jgi:hypothetical protein